MSTIPVHPTTGLRAIGLTKRGRPIWPILGGSEDADPGIVESGPDGETHSATDDSKAFSFDSKEARDEWVNKVVENRLSRERKKYEPLVAERDTLKAEVERLKPLEEATQTDAQRWEAEKATLANELEELRSFKSQAERLNLVRQVADEKGLPAGLVKYVTGNDADSITESVEDLLNVLEDGKPKKPAPQKPKPADEKPPTRGHGGGGSDDDSDSATTSRIIKKYRESRNTFSL